jgi:hypothetical protein
VYVGYSINEAWQTFRPTKLYKILIWQQIRVLRGETGVAGACDENTPNKNGQKVVP